ncbi:MAG: cobalamin-dependent protein [Magnetococcales bacterium]|nr:cobalamin-dependent protein [Magnetococcales bacterium]
MENSDSTQQQAVDYLNRHKEIISSLTTDAFWQKNPQWDRRFGEQGKERCRDDALYHLRHLSESIQAGSPLLFYKYLEWSRTLLESLKIEEAHLDSFLKTLLQSLPAEKGSDEVVAFLRSQLENGRTHLKNAPFDGKFSYLPEEEPLASLTRKYLDTMLALKRREGCQLILNAVENGTSIRDIYLGVFEPVQHEIGLLWQTNKISVATEHYCTATTQWVMSQLYPLILSDVEPENRVIAASVGGELHEIGIRMVADLFELSGWESMFLGANIPAQGLIAAIEDFQPHVLALSVTLPYHLSLLKEMVGKVREVYPEERLPILVGGQPFNQDRDLWKLMGAQATATDAGKAVTEANNLIMRNMNFAS